MGVHYIIPFAFLCFEIFNNIFSLSLQVLPEEGWKPTLEPGLSTTQKPPHCLPSSVQERPTAMAGRQKKESGDTGIKPWVIKRTNAFHSTLTSKLLKVPTFLFLLDKSSIPGGGGVSFLRIPEQGKGFPPITMFKRANMWGSPKMLRCLRLAERGLVKHH